MITEPHSDVQKLESTLQRTGLWTDEAGAVAIVDTNSEKLIGTCHFYRSAPCIHGIEIGYVIHSPSNRGKGHASAGLRLISDFLFANRSMFYRQQLLIEVWNTASWKVAERAGFIREGILRSAGFSIGDPADCFVYSRTQKDYREELSSTNGAHSNEASL